MTALHPSLVFPVASQLARLRGRYGTAPKVEVYAPKPNDMSLGYTEGTTIRLNGFWWAEPAGKLRDAVEIGNRPGDPEVPTWHAGMAEPDHTITHEYAHALWNDRLRVRPEFQRFVREGYRSALSVPSLAPSGYALADDQEYWAEVFAAAELGLAGNAAVDEARELLEELR